jgi:putative FmdB family regulatory protein
MPLYEYHCLDCGEDFEKLVRFSELESLPDCPFCHSTHTQKKISIFAAGNFASRSAATGSSQSTCSAPTNRFR